MRESLLRQANQAYFVYHQAIECNAPIKEQTRLFEQWYRLYCKAICDGAPLMPGA